MTNSQAWDYAIGMIKVDGLEPTEDFKKYIEKEKRRNYHGRCQVLSGQKIQNEGVC